MASSQVVGPDPAGSHAPAGLVGKAPQAVADGSTRPGSAPHGLIDRLAEVTAERSRQGPDVLRHLAEFLVPVHTERLRRSACLVIHPQVESALLRGADPDHREDDLGRRALRC